MQKPVFMTTFAIFLHIRHVFKNHLIRWSKPFSHIWGFISRFRCSMTIFSFRSILRSAEGVQGLVEKRMHFYVCSKSAEKQFKAVFVIISRCLTLLLILHLLTRSSAHKPSETCLLIPESIGRPHRNTGLPQTRGQPPASGVCCARGQASLEMMEEHVEACGCAASLPHYGSS